MVFVLYSGTIKLKVDRDVKLIRLSTIISPYLAKFMKHNKSNTKFVHEIVVIFCPVYLSEATYHLPLLYD